MNSSLSAKQIIDTFNAVLENRGFDPQCGLNYYYQDILNRVHWHNIGSPEKMQKILINLFVPISASRLVSDLANINYVGLAAEKYCGNTAAALIIQYFDYNNEGIVNRVIDLSLDADVNNISVANLGLHMAGVLAKFEIIDKVVCFTAAADTPEDQEKFFGNNENAQVPNLFQILQTNILGREITGFRADPHNILRKTFSNGMQKMIINIEAVVQEIAAFFACGHYKDILQPPVLLEKFFCDEYPRIKDHYWLSMVNSIRVILEEFLPAQAYFANDCLPNIAGIVSFLRHPYALPYLVFFTAILDHFLDNLRSFEQNLNAVVVQFAHVQLMKTAICDAAFQNPRFKRTIAIIEKERGSDVYRTMINDMNMFLRFFFSNLDGELTPFESFRFVQWMCLSGLVGWTDISSSLRLFANRGVSLDLDKLLEEINSLNAFLKMKFKQRAKFMALSVDKKWAMFFKHYPENENSQLLKMVQFVFAFMMRADHALQAVTPLLKDFRWALPNEVDLRVGHFRLGPCLANDTIKALLVVLINLHDMRPHYLMDLLRSEKTLLEKFQEN